MSENMIFCNGEGKYEHQGIGYQKNHHIFNKPVSKEEYKKVKDALDVKSFKLPLTSGVKFKDIENPTTTQEQVGGYLKRQNYQDAWKEMWGGMSQEDKDFITSIIYFDKDIFKEITGIDVEDEPEEMTMDEVCKALGKTIKIKK